MRVDLGASKTYLNKEHRRHLKNIVTLLFGPQQVTILNVNIETQLSRTADDLIHLLNLKKDILNPNTLASTKGALIKIAQLLQKDNTPVLEKLIKEPTPYSEGVGVKDMNVNTLTDTQRKKLRLSRVKVCSQMSKKRTMRVKDNAQENSKEKNMTKICSGIQLTPQINPSLFSKYDTVRKPNTMFKYMSVVPKNRKKKYAQTKIRQIDIAIRKNPQSNYI